MLTLSQNKKIAISAIALFLVSFLLMLFFLENGVNGPDHGQVDVFHAGQDSLSEASLEETYRGYLKDSEAPMFVVNAEGEIIYASDDLCEILVVNCDDFGESVLFDYINSKDLSEFVANYSKLIRDGEVFESFGPFRMLRKDSEILVLFSAYPILDKEEKVIEIVFSIKDLTEQVEELNKDIEEEEEESSWIQNLYPKVKEMKDESDIRFMADKA